MKAITFSSHGGPEVLTYTDVDTPRPRLGQLLVEVEASGVNFIDTYRRAGLYPVELPSLAGVEGVGRVTALGEGTGTFSVGDRVAWCDCPGSYAEFVAVPADSCVPVPEHVPAPVAASLLLQGMTAHYLINSTFDALPGSTVLVHAGAGGVGLLITQLAVAKGVRVITTASTADKRALSLRAGASEALPYEGFADAVLDLTDGTGVVAVYDGVGRTTFDDDLRCLRRRGMLVLYGAASGPVPPVDPQTLNSHGSLFLTRPTLADYVATPEELQWRAGELFSDLTAGVLSVRIGATYPLGAAARAHADLHSRATTGSLVLLPEADARA